MTKLLVMIFLVGFSSPVFAEEFVLLDTGGTIQERATLIQNLTRAGDPSLQLQRIEGDFLIGDKFQNGKVIQVDNPSTERGRMTAEIAKKNSARAKLKTIGLTDDEINFILR